MKHRSKTMRSTRYTRDITSRATAQRKVQRERLWVNDYGREEWRVEIPWCYSHELERIAKQQQ